jgi:hypothetical protein
MEGLGDKSPTLHRIRSCLSKILLSSPEVSSLIGRMEIIKTEDLLNVPFDFDQPSLFKKKDLLMENCWNQNPLFLENSHRIEWVLKPTVGETRWLTKMTWRCTELKEKMRTAQRRVHPISSRKELSQRKDFTKMSLKQHSQKWK